nr:MAG TPA: minor tail protein [Caudoviricetes sp.]
MADNTIDSLVLEISANSKGAEASLNKLTDSLAKLQRRLGGFKGFDNVCAGMERLGKASRTLNPEKLNGYSSALGSFAEAASKLSEMKPTDVNRAVKSLEKLGHINLDGIARQINALKGVDTAALNHLGTAFQGFTASLAGSEKVTAGTSKLFTSLSQMSASADNMAVVQSSLPGLSVEIRKFIDTMAAAPAVSAAAVSLVTALSGMASAGNKIQQTVSSLPGLTAGIQSFIQSLSSAPKLNNNVVRVVESLAKIAPAGAKAGSAARNLQKNIQSLSGSMAGLEKNSRRGLLGIKNFGGQILSLAGLAGGIYGLITGIKNAINYSSDLAEAQNVVEQGFGSLSYMADDFASNSVQAFGMSALSAKKMSGQFAAMGRSLGVVPERAAEMSLSLTGLAGDLASFWNVSHDVAQTALESVFTGETESLKKFAVVMTQANLQQFAYSKGINKSVSAMTQAEQAQLRYAYVMEATAAAHGDFSRTSNEWAGQTRILAGQFQNLAGIIGGGLKAAFLPVITVINALVAKIISLANLISSFIGKLFGVKPQAASAGAGLSEMAESAGSLGNNMDAAAGGIGEIGDAAKKSQKSLNGFIAGWHEVNNMTSNEGAGGSGGGGGAGSLPDMALPEKYELDITAEDEASPVIEDIRKRLLELSSLFSKGFRVGLGDMSVFDSIRQNIQSIRASFEEIFSDGRVATAFNHMLDALAYNAGAKVGSFVSVGSTIVDNITGGISLYLGKSKENIQSWLISMFDITAQSDTILTNFQMALADIFTVFRSEPAKQITADIIQVFADGFMGATELAGRLGTSILDMILTPITENSSGFKEALSNTLGPISEVLTALANSFSQTWSEINQMYKKHIAPMFSSIRDGLSEVIETLLSGYNTYFAPVLDSLAGKFSEVWGDHIQPLLSSFIDLFGEVATFIENVWKSVFQPLLNWVADKIFPVISPVLEGIGTLVLTVFAGIADTLNGFITVATGVIGFVNGVFSGDWSKAWEGVKTVFKGVWDAMPDFIKGPIKLIIGFVNSMIGAIENGINFVVRGMNNLQFDVPDWVPGIGGETFGFDLNEISLPRIPQLARGGVLEKGQVGLLEGNGAEAVVPLEKNTKWISRVAATMSDEFGKYRLNTFVPKQSLSLSSYSYEKLKSAMQMERDSRVAQQQYEIKRQNQLLEKLISVVEQKELHIGDDDVFNATRRGQNRFAKRTFKTGWAGID